MTFGLTGLAPLLALYSRLTHLQYQILELKLVHFEYYWLYYAATLWRLIDLLPRLLLAL